MTHRSFVVWLVLALVAFTGAVISLLSQPGFQQAQVHDEMVFPELREDPNAAVKLTLATGSKRFNLVRQDGGGWQVEEKSGYPADAKKIRELIATLADSRFVEAKTALPDSFPRLELEDVDAEGAKSRRLTLTSADGKALADVILGKRSAQRTSRDKYGTYLRRHDAQQAWLVNREIRVDGKVEDWLEREILNIAPDEIDILEITPAGGDGYSIARVSPDGDFVLADAPEGKTLDQAAVKRIASGLHFLNLQDVKPRDQFEMPETRSVARLTTTDGLGVLAEVATLDDKHWAYFTVGYAGEAAEGSEEAKAAAEKADALNAKVGAWVFEVTKFEADRFRQALDELFQKSDESS